MKHLSSLLNALLTVLRVLIFLAACLLALMLVSLSGESVRLVISADASVYLRLAGGVLLGIALDRLCAYFQNTIRRKL